MDLEKFNKFLDYLRRGHIRSDALALSGIELYTFRDWMAKAKNGVEPFASTCRLADIAEAESVDKYMVTVEKLAKSGNLKAAEFMLKSIRPDRFREKPMEVNVNQQQAVQLTTTEAKEKLYGYAIELFKKEPLYLERLKGEFLLAPSGERDIIVTDLGHPGQPALVQDESRGANLLPEGDQTSVDSGMEGPHEG